MTIERFHFREARRTTTEDGETVCSSQITDMELVVKLHGHELRLLIDRWGLTIESTSEGGYATITAEEMVDLIDSRLVLASAQHRDSMQQELQALEFENEQLKKELKKKTDELHSLMETELEEELDTHYQQHMADYESDPERADHPLYGRVPF